MEGEAGGHSQRAAEGGRSSEEEPPTGGESRAAQARTFTRWINLVLETSDPPAAVNDLFQDVQDGRILMALLERLSGSRLLYRFRAPPQRVFRVKNISKVLAFLDHQAELLGISAAAVADGDPPAVLGLLWSIVLRFQVKPVAGGFGEPSSSPGNHGKTVGALLRRVQRCTSKFGVEVQDFGESWRSGLAFLALIQSLSPARVDLVAALSREPRDNLRLAFSTARRCLGVAPLLEPDDVLSGLADETSIVTYVSMFFQRCPTHEDCSGSAADAGTHLQSFRTGFGSIDPEAQALLERSEASSERELWRKWSRRDPNPPSPLDAGVSGPEIRSWMKEARSAYRSRFSLSSEEGIYSLAAAAAVEPEDGEARSPGTDPNAGAFQPAAEHQRGGGAEERMWGQKEGSGGETGTCELEGAVGKTGACRDESSASGGEEGAGSDGTARPRLDGDGATKINRSEADGCKEEREEQTESSVFERGGRGSEKTKSGEEEEEEEEGEEEEGGSSSRIRGCSGSCQTLRKSPAPEASSAGLSPSEARLLVLLWILTYCSLILHHMVS